MDKFNIEKYLISKGFKKTRDIDKREEYILNFEDKVFTNQLIAINLTINYQSHWYKTDKGEINIPYLHVRYFPTDSEKYTVYYGVCPTDYESIETVFEHIFPSHLLLNRFL